MRTPDWQTERPIQGRDLDWHPVLAKFGTVLTENGVRVAVQIGDSLGIFAPGDDAEAAAELAAAVEVRVAGADS